jgi:carbamoyltransferase
MVLNTSFNVRGEPIVCTPDDAVRCFLGTQMDVLVLGDAICRKPESSAG